MNYDLPSDVEINGTTYPIRTDYRAILDICVALSDPELDERDKSFVALIIFYPGFEDMPPEDYEEALKRCFWFISAGEDESGQKHSRLMDWEQDFSIIAPPINRVLGKDIRKKDEYTHWWTFVGAYYEIGDCTFAQVVSIRDKLARHKKLEKWDKEWLQRNRKLVDFKTKYTEEEEDLFKMWL